MSVAFTIVRGDDEILDLAFKEPGSVTALNPSGTPLDLTGATGIWFTAKHHSSDADVDAVIRKALGVGISIVSEPEGTATVTIDAEDTADARPGVLVWDAQVRDAAGKIRTAANGSLKLSADVTRAPHEAGVPVLLPPLPDTDGYVLTIVGGVPVWLPVGGGHVIKNVGTPLVARPGLNFTGSGVTTFDDQGSDETVVQIAGNNGHGIQDHGSNTQVEPVLDFEGAGVVVTDDTGVTIVTIPGGGGEERITLTIPFEAMDPAYIVNQAGTGQSPQMAAGGVFLDCGAGPGSVDIIATFGAGNYEVAAPPWDGLKLKFRWKDYGHSLDTRASVTVGDPTGFLKESAAVRWTGTQYQCVTTDSAGVEQVTGDPNGAGLTWRIEFTATDVKFYNSGILVATHTVNIPGSNVFYSARYIRSYVESLATQTSYSIIAFVELSWPETVL